MLCDGEIHTRNDPFHQRNSNRDTNKSAIILLPLMLLYQIQTRFLPLLKDMELIIKNFELRCLQSLFFHPSINFYQHSKAIINFLKVKLKQTSTRWIILRLFNSKGRGFTLMAIFHSNLDFIARYNPKPSAWFYENKRPRLTTDPNQKIELDMKTKVRSYARYVRILTILQHCLIILQYLLQKNYIVIYTPNYF